MREDRCPDCGAPKTADEPCFRCMMELGVPGDETRESGPVEIQPVAPLIRPDRIGPYKILETLGEGGMGVVYLAEQSVPVRRRVAVKIIKRGKDTQQVLARFEAERQAMAMMNHPTIAKVFDAGVTAEGLPYFVMEHVPGIPITDHCDREKMPNHERLGLFRQVCEGIQHAHHKAIIHRDIKPSNVLVAMVDGKPMPKIIDFGIAKAVSQKLIDITLQTELGVLIGTPAYMSPEQAEMTGHDVDTRTDVYALGVLLYELLVGALPFDDEELRKVGIEAMVRRIREEDPLIPSARVSTLGERSTQSARFRRTGPPALRRELQGDLDWITMKALEKDRARRYSSPGELAADIERHLLHEPVIAGPPGAIYRIKKFVRRHRAAVTLVTVIFLLLAGIAARERGQSNRIARERDRAEREADTANQVSDFLFGLFSGAEPSKTRGEVVTARDLLDRGAAEIGDDLEEQPEVRARLMDLIGHVYHNLGAYDEAEELLDAALAIRRSSLGAEDPATLRTMRKLANVYRFQDRRDEAESLLLEAVEAHERALGGDHPDTLLAQTLLASLCREAGRYEEAETRYLEILATRARVLGEEDPSTLETKMLLAELYRLQGRYDGAEPLIREALAGLRASLGDDHPRTLTSIDGLCRLLNSMKQPDKAEPPCAEVLERNRRVRGNDHTTTLMALNNLASVYSKQKRYDEAEALYLEALETQRRLHGDDHTTTVMSMNNLAVLYLKQGRPDEAEPLYLHAMEIYGRVLGEDHPNTAVPAHNLGNLYRDAGRTEESARYYERAQRIFEAKLPPNHPFIAENLKQWARLLRNLGDTAGAERLEARAAGTDG